MTAAITLLMLALQLLTAVANTPNAPQSLRDSATRVANIAIQEANKQLATNQGVPTTSNITVPAVQSQTPTGVQISSVNVMPTITSAKIEWQTNIPTNSKVFLSGGGLSSKVYNSESGLSTRHVVSISKLLEKANYLYEIEAIGANQQLKKYNSDFSTLEQQPTEIQAQLAWRLYDDQTEVDRPKCITPVVQAPMRVVLSSKLEGKNERALGWFWSSESALQRYNIKSVTFHNKGTQNLRDLSPRFKASIWQGNAHGYAYYEATYTDDNTAQFNNVPKSSTNPELMVNPTSWQTGKTLDIEVSDIVLWSDNPLQKPVVSNLPLIGDGEAVVKCEAM